LKPAHITSRDNSLLRQVRAVRDGKVAGLIYVEGLRLCEEASRSGVQIEAVIYSEQLAQKDRAAKLLRELETVAPKSASVSEKLLESISFTKTPQGIVAIAKRPDTDLQSFHSQQHDVPLLVILHHINNPVNVGAIVRTAEAAGATGVIATAGTADPFSPKALRGAMGAAFRLPILSGADYAQAIDWCRRDGAYIVCADVHATRNYHEFDWSRPAAIVMGAESSGLSPEEIALADESIRIPMKGSTESLNVAVAAGILLYEASRHRAS
jgi:TrmH family RNA methyltransferase